MQLGISRRLTQIDFHDTQLDRKQNRDVCRIEKTKSLTATLHRLLHLTYGSNVRALSLPQVQRTEHLKEPIEMDQLLIVP